MEEDGKAAKANLFADARPDGSCVDVVRVRDRGRTLFEFCGSAAGARVISTSNMLTLDLVASRKLYSARGFLLQYQGEQRCLLKSILSFRVLLFLCSFSCVCCYKLISCSPFVKVSASFVGDDNGNLITVNSVFRFKLDFCPLNAVSFPLTKLKRVNLLPLSRLLCEVL
jgi:hypothetical protein